MTVRKKKRRAYYGKKGGSAEYKDEINFGVYSTLKTIRDFYEGKNEKAQNN